MEETARVLKKQILRFLLYERKSLIRARFFRPAEDKKDPGSFEMNRFLWPELVGKIVGKRCRIDIVSCFTPIFRYKIPWNKTTKHKTKIIY